jgi:hypothetical protein
VTATPLPGTHETTERLKAEIEASHDRLMNALNDLLMALPDPAPNIPLLEQVRAAAFAHADEAFRFAWHQGRIDLETTVALEMLSTKGTKH